MADIFISYAREDLKRIKLLVEALTKQGWSVFWDRRIRAGQKFSSVIENELQNAQCAIVAWSEHSVNSDWVHDEATEAKERNILVPVLLDVIKPPMGFRRIHAADLTVFGTGKRDSVLEQLFEDIREIVGEPSRLHRDVEEPIKRKPEERMEPFDLVDVDGATYKTIQIGKQVWMAENLDVSRYRNGDAIPRVQDPEKWAELTTGAWCYYDNDTGNGRVYGKLYNWYAVNDPRGLAPEGWHVPSDKEWQELERFLGMSRYDAEKTGLRGSIGGKLKEAGSLHWREPNAGATNETGFTALAGGYRYYNGGFFYIGGYASFWSSSAYGDAIAWNRKLSYLGTEVYRDLSNRRVGMSVRCVRDD
ncbi:TIR protein [Prosthecochloris aestuarii DSM 271]|uniref:TIR protein n=1 Tax=Prosthecochloris aestuarii (strain DSM 271 / SK 413) TaxID=290512 RepID=B4S3R6_PROA2|nr:FISUMP domain-containing protein [Prosthecochloris aestuarii]ACF45262.1 TIR protein [Prosthecochloris aestuarii DSM 271]